MLPLAYLGYLAGAAALAALASGCVEENPTPTPQPTGDGGTPPVKPDAVVTSPDAGVPDVYIPPQDGGTPLDSGHVAPLDRQYISERDTDGNGDLRINFNKDAFGQRGPVGGWLANQGVGDVTGDGIPDLVTGDSEGVHIQAGPLEELRGSKSFADATYNFTNAPDSNLFCSGITLVPDRNQDNREELLVTCRSTPSLNEFGARGIAVYFESSPEWPAANCNITQEIQNRVNGVSPSIESPSACGASKIGIITLDPTQESLYKNGQEVFHTLGQAIKLINPVIGIDGVTPNYALNLSAAAFLMVPQEKFYEGRVINLQALIDEPNSNAFLISDGRIGLFSAIENHFVGQGNGETIVGFSDSNGIDGWGMISVARGADILARKSPVGFTHIEFSDPNIGIPHARIVGQNDGEALGQAPKVDSEFGSSRIAFSSKFGSFIVPFTYFDTLIDEVAQNCLANNDTCSLVAFNADEVASTGGQVINRPPNMSSKIGGHAFLPNGSFYVTDPGYESKGAGFLFTAGMMSRGATFTNSPQITIADSGMTSFGQRLYTYGNHVLVTSDNASTLLEADPNP